MFEKLRSFITQSKSMLQDAFEVPEEDDFVAVPEGVTAEQLIEEAKQYVDAIIVNHHADKASPSVYLKTGDADEVPDTELKEEPAQDDADFDDTGTDNENNNVEVSASAEHDDNSQEV